AGKTLDTYLIWRVDGEGKGMAGRLPKTALPGFLTAAVENLNDRWSVHLLDKARPWPNHRGLPIRDGRAFAQLDTNDADMDLFIGHPVIADNSEVILQAEWKSKGLWHIEAHNPTDQTLRCRLTAHPEWGIFAFDESIELAPGSSRHWDVQEERK
ncbi:MAG: hypothetical protein N3A66_00120, partial [Planctomycetota bacterium]|nr:hypothetical protein [Planctomycetota bacterium]